ncbi:hypothetical protein PHYBLDRAFT_148081 [Phycomyces blakesleeanus NRRL 1555(-)]|uniref:Uncharacterized protein n=1 Tax=Phycomyces blakesleeanus (strain ATCC 8743b / DSM 1359 / FGSC 10004 / NBRC 33097 / NRRL 1555) TaxID=763407 RepID=A0A162TTI9_PHYB8|nr:hypothetical protein PHYBLDRAFT_148081 [Phycomyces blakesleeanus NRRL 1555(-)]OAD70862.1 hypothetical protein PHYBLDRAFT_148081 [Phycomyces blakesleeanus NRRL 1555(-)]|eukprot:XP_018288902.1 hypothetical protein PHYBLDRAFT_148081 [Phycomyces blakesleeanus NRRL 1555(-)]
MFRNFVLWKYSEGNAKGRVKEYPKFCILNINIQVIIDGTGIGSSIAIDIEKKTLAESLSASTDELIKDIPEVIEEEVNVKLEQIAIVKELEQILKSNKYIHKVDNVLPDLESKERTLGFLDSLGAYGFKEEIRMCKSLFYEFCTNFVLLSFGVFNYELISLANIHTRI